MTIPLPEPLVSIFVVAFGLVVGSFLNVCIYRLPLGESVVRPRSRCTRCSTLIPWYHNIPLLSWLLLRGRCATCAAPISSRYPFVEALTAVTVLLLPRLFYVEYEIQSYPWKKFNHFASYGVDCNIIPPS